MNYLIQKRHFSHHYSSFFNLLFELISEAASIPVCVTEDNTITKANPIIPMIGPIRIKPIIKRDNENKFEIKIILLCP